MCPKNRRLGLVPSPFSLLPSLPFSRPLLRSAEMHVLRIVAVGKNYVGKNYVGKNAASTPIGSWREPCESFSVTKMLSAMSTVRSKELMACRRWPASPHRRIAVEGVEGVEAGGDELGLVYVVGGHVC